MKRRATDGFAIGYNIIFPSVMILLLGALSRKGNWSELTSYQYYIVVTIPFCIAMAVITAAYAGKDDAYAKTAERVLISPVSVKVIVWSKVISTTIVFSLCSILVFIVSGIFFDMKISGILVPMILLYLSLSFFVSAIGTYIGLGMKNFLTIKNIINIPIGIFAIPAGTFFPIGTLDRKLQFLIQLSPLTWVNRCIFLAMYDHDFSLIFIVMAFSFLLGLIVVWISMITFNKEEYVYGNLPGYEK